MAREEKKELPPPEQTEPHKHKAGGPLGIELPPKTEILSEARARASDRNSSLQPLTNLVVQDPVTTLEFLRIANAMFFAQDRPAILTVKNAIVRLGSENLVELFDRLQNRPQFLNSACRDIFELLREQAQRVSIVARLIASSTYREIAEVVQTIGLMTNMGHMIACCYFENRYAALAEQLPRATVVYRLAHEFSFDVRSMQLAYLRMHGLPQALFYALDRELVCKTPGQATMRFIVECAQELVDAYGTPKWEKYSSRDTLPSKSSFRLLKISDFLYREVFNSTEAFLKEGREPGELVIPAEEEAIAETGAVRAETTALVDEEIASLSAHGISPEDQPETQPKKKSGSGGLRLVTPPEYVEEPRDKPPEDDLTLSPDCQKVVALFSELSRKCQRVEDLLTGLLQILINDAPFLRAALIVLSEDRTRAFIHTAVGDGLSSGHLIALDDPLSPLALCLTKVKSFNSQEIQDALSPFGISSYALSPVRLTNKNPVLLYADCGLQSPITFEARKVFRRVVGMLNSRLPELPGSLPMKSLSVSAPQ